MNTIQIPFLNEILLLNTSERIFILNKIYESLINELPNQSKKKKQNNTELPEWLLKNFDEQTKDFASGTLKTFTWDEVLVSLHENKDFGKI